MGNFTFVAYQPTSLDVHSSDFVFHNRIGEQELIEHWAQCLFNSIDPSKFGWTEDYEFYILENGIQVYDVNKIIIFPEFISLTDRIVEIERKARELAGKKKEEKLQEMAEAEKAKEDLEKAKRLKEYEKLKAEFGG